MEKTSEKKTPHREWIIHKTLMDKNWTLSFLSLSTRFPPVVFSQEPAWAESLFFHLTQSHTISPSPGGNKNPAKFFSDRSPTLHLQCHVSPFFVFSSQRIVWLSVSCWHCRLLCSYFSLLGKHLEDSLKKKRHFVTSNAQYHPACDGVSGRKVPGTNQAMAWSKGRGV